MTSMGGTSMSPVQASFTGSTSAGFAGTLSPTPAAAARPAVGATSTTPSAGKPSSNFDDLWSLGLGASGKPSSGSSGNTGASAGKSMKDLEREKAQAGIWGASQGHRAQSSVGSFGAFGGASSGGASGGGGDDLLL